MLCAPSFYLISDLMLFLLPLQHNSKCQIVVTEEQAHLFVISFAPALAGLKHFVCDEVTGERCLT